MIFDAFFQACFFAGALFLQHVFNKAPNRLTERVKQEEETLSLSHLAISIGLSFLAVLWLLTSEGVSQDMFLIAFFTVNLTLTLATLFRVHALYLTVCSLLVMVMVTSIPHPYAINVIQAASLMWVWPFMIKKYPGTTRYAVGGLLLILVIDILNISIAQTYHGYVFAPLLFSFFVIFGSNILGIGDYLIGYLCVTLLAHRKMAHHPIIILLFVLIAAIPLGLLTLFLRHGFALPYSIFIILPYLAVAAAAHASEVYDHQVMWFEEK